MKFSPTQIHELATDTHFPPENFEKVLRLRELLIEFHKHTVLNGKLVLKGGTPSISSISILRDSVSPQGVSGQRL